MRKEFKFIGILNESVVYYVGTLNDFASLTNTKKITVNDYENEIETYKDEVDWCDVEVNWNHP